MILSEMAVGIASSAFMYNFQDVFPRIEIIPLSIIDYPTYDLVIFPGGEDINPEIYGEEKKGAVGISISRDARELQVLDGILKTGKIKCPKIFGACRGIQLLNAYFGGTLHQDLGKLRHRGTHEIIWEKDSNVGALGNLHIINSLHHQGIKSLAKNARILGKETETGIIEMAEFAHETVQIFASQFHPEFFIGEKRNWFFEELLILMEKRSKLI